MFPGPRRAMSFDDRRGHVRSRSLPTRTAGRGCGRTLGLALAGTLGPIARASGADHGSRTGPWGFDGYGPLRRTPRHCCRRVRYTRRRIRVTRLDSGEPSPDSTTVRRASRPGDGSVWWRTTRSASQAARPTACPRCPGSSTTGVNGGTTTIGSTAATGCVSTSACPASSTLRRRKDAVETWLTCEETFEPVGGDKPHPSSSRWTRTTRRPTATAADPARSAESAPGRRGRPDRKSIYETEDTEEPDGLSHHGTPRTASCRWPRGPARPEQPAGTLAASQPAQHLAGSVPDPLRRDRRARVRRGRGDRARSLTACIAVVEPPVQRGRGTARRGPARPVAGSPWSRKLRRRWGTVARYFVASSPTRTGQSSTTARRAF